LIRAFPDPVLDNRVLLVGLEPLQFRRAEPTNSDALYRAWRRRTFAAPDEACTTSCGPVVRSARQERAE
jgi:hypothetical protein